MPLPFFLRECANMGQATDKDYLQYKGRFPKNSKIFQAMFVDLVAVNLIAIVVLKIYGLIAGSFLDKYTMSYIGFGIYLICLLYVPVMSAKGQTLGQRLFHLKIQKVDGSNMSVATAVKRWLFSVVSPFGYNHKKVPWFDRKYDTILIHSK